jgi:hypothetical protein
MILIIGVTILTVTTGRLVSRRHVDGIYDILNFMTGDNLFTHQLPRGMDECAPSLRVQFPDLAAVEVPEGVNSEETVYAWLDGQVAIHGETREVVPLRAEEHTYIDPITEIRKMAPHAEVIAIEVPEAQGER